MKTNVQQTSLLAYAQISPEIGRRQAEVYEVIQRKFNITNTEIAQELAMPINSITPRVHELRKKDLVEEWGKRPCRVTGKQVMAWAIKVK